MKFRWRRSVSKPADKRYSQLLAELAFHEWGSPEHLEAAYQIHCLNVVIRNDKRARGTEYQVPRKQFEKHYYGINQ